MKEISELTLGSHQMDIAEGSIMVAPYRCVQEHVQAGNVQLL
jgi:hypothetical protein